MQIHTYTKKKVFTHNTKKENIYLLKTFKHIQI